MFGLRRGAEKMKLFSLWRARKKSLRMWQPWWLVFTYSLSGFGKCRNCLHQSWFQWWEPLVCTIWHLWIFTGKRGLSGRTDESTWAFISFLCDSLDLKVALVTSPGNQFQHMASRQCSTFQLMMIAVTVLWENDFGLSMRGLASHSNSMKPYTLTAQPYIWIFFKSC